MSNFSGLGIALRGMQANQTAMEVTSHNISNVNTEGYTRQKAIMQTDNPNQGAFLMGQLGSGVKIVGIERVADTYLENRIQNQNAYLSYWSSKSDILHKVEGDVISLDLADRLNSFWSSWQKLSLNPDANDIKFVVQQEGEALVDTINAAIGQMLDIRNEINNTISDHVKEVNLLADQIAELNNEISKYTNKGQTPNDLLDRRTMLLKSVVGLTGAAVESNEENDAMVNVTVGSKMVISGGSVDPLTVDEVEDEADIIDGSIKGLIDVREKNVNSYLIDLNTLVKNLINGVNDIHDSSEFFGGVETEEVNGEVLSKLSMAPDLEINATSEKALEVYHLMANEPVKFRQVVSGLLSKIGMDTKGADAQKLTSEDMLIEMENSRAAVSGVSLDEELTNMLQFQRAYQASAKVLTVIDEMLDTLINRTVR